MKTEIKTDSFEGIVRSIANDYINSILFVDERAFNPGPSNETNTNYQKALDVAAVSKAFSKAGKICGFYAPKTSEDIEECKRLVLKPDIVVLDWDIDIKGKKALSKEEELEDDETDVRGYYTLQLLKCIAEDANTEKLKVVFIYTGESSIDGILLDIEKKLGASFHKNDERFEIDSDNVHVIVRLKPESKVSLAGFDRFIVSYENLPDEVLSCFADYVRGLMPCFAMKCITAVRESSAKILKVFNKGLDAELLAHELSIPDPEDSKTYIAKSFGSAITDLVLEDESIDTDLWVEPWIESHCSDNRDNLDIGGIIIKTSKESLNKFFRNRKKKPDLAVRFKSAFGVSIDDNIISVTKSLSRLFHQDYSIIESSRYEFASLLHRKNILSKSNSIPTLTLGCVVEKGDGNYYVCIQQRCDSLRIPNEGRDFLFLPLIENKEKNVICAILIAPGKYVYVPKQSYNLSVFTFRPKKSRQPIKAVKENGQFVFQSVDGITFKWLAELNEINAQRIVTAFTSQLSRVGLDEAEWLRVEGMNG